MKSSITFRKILSTEPVANYLGEVIIEHLSNNRKVLWLVPGGSAIRVAVEASKQLPKDYLKNLTVTLSDERYGPVGHVDSNWPQLEAAGFNLKNATLQPVLRDQNLEQTTETYSKILKEGFEQADFSIALAGMGPDGHIFGIKPASPAVNSDKIVVSYKWDDYTRITPTFEAIKKLDEVVIYTVGAEKWPQLDNLDKDLSVDKQPAQLLKRLKKVIIFNDYKGKAE